MPTPVQSAARLTLAPVRTPHPTLALFAIPALLASAFLVDEAWAVIPLALCAWWWAPPRPRWNWLIAVGRGVVATEWTMLGSGALACFPEQAMLIGLGWAGIPMVVALRRVPAPPVPRHKHRSRRPGGAKLAVRHLS
ncbi:MAG: hypothetical protein QOF36_1327 [Microbacteriaceae bacterium]|jgi:hypothetical protein|nr:hypothetical protein [Microbacteriaceae bacterium]